MESTLKISLNKTEQALQELYAHTYRNPGMHTYPEQRVAADGLDLGSQDFDAERHEAHLIDPLSAMEEVFETPQVRLVLPNKPIIATIIMDKRVQDVNQRIADSKLRAIQEIGSLIYDSTAPLDFVFNKAVLETGSSDEEDQKDVIDETNQGLGIIVSDFSRFDFKKGEFGNRSDVLAVKVNHPIELEVPANVGRLVLGGIWEINTDNADELADYNQALAERHAAIMENIRNAGATCVQVVVDANVDHRFDRLTTDKILATAISNFSK